LQQPVVFLSWKYWQTPVPGQQVVRRALPQLLVFPQQVLPWQATDLGQVCRQQF
jgi:hypothetical protein